MRLTSKLLYGLLALLLGILCPTAAYATPEDGDTVKDESSLDVTSSGSCGRSVSNGSRSL